MSTMFTKPVEFYDAVITSIHHKIEDGAVNSRLQVTATLTPDLADVLEAGSLVFLKNGAPKEGFSRLELSTGCGSYRALFEAPAELRQTFEITGDSTEKYLVERQAEGRLQLKLRLHFNGDPHQALAFVMTVGSGESTLKITPLQASLMDQEEQPARVNGHAKKPVDPLLEEAKDFARGRGRKARKNRELAEGDQ